MWKISPFFCLDKCLILIISPLFLINEKSYFRTESANIKIKSFEKHLYPLRTLSYKAVKGTAVNQALPSFHETGGSLGITLKLHLKTIRVEYN